VAPGAASSAAGTGSCAGRCRAAVAAGANTAVDVMGVAVAGVALAPSARALMLSRQAVASDRGKKTRMRARFTVWRCHSHSHSRIHCWTCGHARDNRGNRTHAPYLGQGGGNAGRDAAREGSGHSGDSKVRRPSEKTAGLQPGASHSASQPVNGEKSGTRARKDMMSSVGDFRISKLTEL